MTQSKKPRLIPITEWSKYHDWPTYSGLRWMLYNQKPDGFESCVRRVGGRVLIAEDEFFEWVEKENAK